MNRSKKRPFLFLMPIVCTAGYFFFDGPKYFTFENLKAHQQALIELYQGNSVIFMLSFFLIYCLSTALSIPVATLLSLLAGAILGIFWGVVFVSLASTLGATLAFLLSRYLFREILEKKFENLASKINKGVEANGQLYLLYMRLVPIMPFFVINTLFGLTRIKLSQYFWTSLIGMLPGIVVYLNAGNKLGELQSVDEIFAPSFFLSFAFIGLLPFVLKYLWSIIAKSRGLNL